MSTRNKRPMEIVYRISPFKPDNLPVYYPDDKWKLVQMCHKSFLNAGGGNYKITYIINSCDWGKHFKGGDIVKIRATSKLESLRAAFKVGLETGEDVLFVEDDYLWRPGTIPLLEHALKTLRVMSPYDHPSHYAEERFNDFPFRLKQIGNEVYRTCPSTTHTFAVTKDVMKENYNLISDYGVQDHEMYTELNKVAQLWCPTYSFATHLAGGNLAPNVNWREFANLTS